MSFILYFKDSYLQPNTGVNYPDTLYLCILVYVKYAAN